MPVYTVDVMEYDECGYPSRWRTRREDEVTAHTAVMDRDPGCLGMPPERDEAVLVTIINDRTGEVVSKRTGVMSDCLSIALDLLRAADPA
jgi:hypothetical protein